jgi:hypothetical protein
VEIERGCVVKVPPNLPIGQVWKIFQIAVLPKTAPEVQVLEMQKAFYAGAAGLFEIMMANAELSDQAAEAAMRDLSNEIQQFAISLQQDNPPTPFDWQH